MSAMPHPYCPSRDALRPDSAARNGLQGADGAVRQGTDPQVTGKLMPKTIGSITALVAAQLALAALATPAGAAGAADECLAGPNAAAPKGSHWYYRVEKTTRRHCWYVGPEGKAVNRAERPASTPVADAETEATATPPTSATPAVSATPRLEAAAVPSVPAMPRQMVQDSRDETAPSQSPGFGQRWSEMPAAAQVPAVPSQSGGAQVGAQAQESASQVVPVTQAAAPPSAGIEVVPPAPEAAADETAPAGGVSVLMLVLVAIGLGGIGLLVRAGLRLWVARRPKIHVDRYRAEWSADWPAEPMREPLAQTDEASFAPPLVPRDAPVRPTDVARFPVEPIALREAEQDLARLLRKVRQRAA